MSGTSINPPTRFRLCVPPPKFLGSLTCTAEESGESKPYGIAGGQRSFEVDPTVDLDNRMSVSDASGMLAALRTDPGADLSRSLDFEPDASSSICPLSSNVTRIGTLSLGAWRRWRRHLP